MLETLYIRLGSQAQDVIHWLVWSSTGQEIIASGELKNVSELGQLSAKAQQRKVIVFVPSCDIALKSLLVPGKSQRAIRLAAPYMLEDELAQDVEQLFFAYANIKSNEQGHNCFIAAVDRRQLNKWLDWLNTANIKCKQMVPDVLAMPVEKNAWTAIELGSQVMLRKSHWQGFTTDTQTWQVISTQWFVSDVEQDEQSKTVKTPCIHHYSPLVNSDKLHTQTMGEELPLALLAQHVTAQSFNLLQGEFEIKERRSSVQTFWLWAASMAVFALLLNVGLKGLELIQLSAQQQAVEQEIIKTYEAVFPGTKRVRVSTIKSQLKQKMSTLGINSGGEKFLSMLAQMQPAFSQVPQLKPENLKFDSKRNELRLQALASDYQHFEQFKNELEKVSLTVSQGAQNNQGEQISGSFSITNSGKKS